MRARLLFGAVAAAILGAALSGAAPAASVHWRRHHQRSYAYNAFLCALIPPVVSPAPPRLHSRLFGPYPLGSALPNGPYPAAPAVPLPQGMQLEIDAPAAATRGAPKRIDRWHEVGIALRACWSPPPPAPDAAFAPADEPREVTLRLGFDRFGRVMGAPRVTYSHPAAKTDVQKAFTAAAVAALDRCSPLPFTPGLGSVIAGVPFAIRFTDRRTPSTDKDRS